MTPSIVAISWQCERVADSGFYQRANHMTAMVPICHCKALSKVELTKIAPEVSLIRTLGCHMCILAPFTYLIFLWDTLSSDAVQLYGRARATHTQRTCLTRK